MEEYMLTTVDNPYNPFTHYDEWNAWDMAMGYNTNGFIARVIITSPDLSDADEEDAIDMAIDEIVRENVYGMHVKVTATDATPRIVTANT